MLKNVAISIFIFFPITILGQVHAEKEVNKQTQSWFSINNNFRFNEHLGLLLDLHVRRNDFVSQDSFYFTRIGVAFMPNSKVLLAAGYAHMWLAPTKEGWNTFSNEDRIYQQAQLSSKIGNVSVLQRIRNEQRWQEKITNDVPTGDNRFTNRVRYLVSFNIPIFKKSSMPSLVISDEILIHFGKEVVYNTVDQNRFFIGIKQNISPKLSFDFGYMNVYQQKYSGYQYDSNHTLRLFFYYNNSFKNLTHFNHHVSGDE
jgi:hypothetical protein